MRRPLDRDTEARTPKYFFTFAIILLMSGIFLVPAWDNGFPFVFFDSGTYLIGGIREPSRPPYYTLFNKFVDLNITPWFGIVLQTLTVSLIIWRLTSSLFEITGFAPLAILAIGLTAGTSLPWFAGWIMPDVFTALMILALALLCFAQDKFSRSWVIVLALGIGAALAFHQANLLVAAWALPALGLCALLGWRPARSSAHGLFAGAAGIAIGVAALVAVNVAAGRGFALSFHGPVVLLARLLDDGTALSYLEEACPQRRFAVCAQLDELKSYRAHPSSNEPLSDYFIWGGPLDKLGGFHAEQPEAIAIVQATLAKYPLVQLRTTIHNGWRQLFFVGTGSELQPYSEEEYVSTAIKSRFGSTVYEQYRNSKQMRNILEFDLLNQVHISVLIASSLFVLGAMVIKVKKPQASLYATLFVLILVIGNAFTLGGLNGPHQRYQSRVIWLVPLLAGCYLLTPQLRVTPSKGQPGNTHSGPDKGVAGAQGHHGGGGV